VVVRAEDLTAGGPVALKFMLPEVAALSETVHRFVREAQALMKVQSEHVARLLDAGNLADGTPTSSWSTSRARTSAALARTRKATLA